MHNFDELALPEAIRHTLLHLNFTTPTPIQAQAIPPALLGKDILGSAQTGTGKTAAFGIPLAAHLLKNPDHSALVMTPTRELAAQVMTQLKAIIGKSSKIKSALLIGGEAMPKQLQQLRQNPRLIVGTPGRINDHLKRRSLSLDDTHFLVLDETDRMLDMGFTIQIEKILSYMPTARQTMLFSATLPRNIVKISEQYLTDPARIEISQGSAAAANIHHDIIRLSEGEKYDRLIAELEHRDGSIILFMKTKYSTEKMARRLSKSGHSADALHGDLRQNKRDRVTAHFRASKFRILVATDVAARGLDIPHVAHVINYDLPQSAEDYIHRIGRTARAGAEGEAICFITPADRGKWYAIERLMNPDGAPQKERSETKRASAKKKKPKKSAARKSAAKATAPKGASKTANKTDRPRSDRVKPEARKSDARKSEIKKPERPKQKSKRPQSKRLEGPRPDGTRPEG